jgi:hypothetical protein
MSCDQSRSRRCFRLFSSFGKSHMSARLIFGLALSLSLTLPAASALAADEAPAAKQDAKADKQQPAAEAPASSDENAERQKLLDSPRWRQARYALHEWISVQQVYTPQEVSKLLADLEHKANTLPIDQLQDWLEDMEEKMTILMSPQAQEARAWLAQFLSVQAKYSPAEIQKMMPDVLRMSAAQVEERLQQFEQERAATQQTQAAFDRNRQQEVNAQRRANEQAQAAAIRAQANRPTPQVPQARSPYAPRRQWTPPQNNMQLYVSPYGRVGVMFGLNRF